MYADLRYYYLFYAKFRSRNVNSLKKEMIASTILEILLSFNFIPLQIQYILNKNNFLGI